jgi:hypothetical protein
VVFESDWLASRPYFYDLGSGRHGHDINEVIDLATLEFDPEGFNDYLHFGYSVFEQTPVKGVRVLRHSTRLVEGPGGLAVETLPDPAEEWYERRSTVDEVVEAVAGAVNDAVDDASGDVVVPTSGGLDSRFINLVVRDRSRVRAFTYGVSDDPARSRDAVKAKEVARRLDLRWELVPIDGFHRHLDAWDALFGVATHAHGMYQMEFYDRVARRVAPGTLMLSGVLGDAFAGDDPEVRRIGKLTRPEDLLTVLHWMPMSADPAQSALRSDGLGARRLFEEEPRLRTELLPRVVAEVRNWMPMMSYLYRVPESFGLRAAAPLLARDVALRMLTLPPESRLDRRWQHELFREHGLDLETPPLPCDERNTLNFRELRRTPLPPLDPHLLSEVVKPGYVRWINRHVGSVGALWEVYWRLGWTRGFRRAVKGMHRMGVADRRSPAYFAYLTLKPVQSLIERRDAARRAEAGR